MRAVRPSSAWLLPALALLLCWPAVSGGAYFERDVNLVWLSQVEVLKRSWLGGAWPTWDPWTGFGQPQLANPSVQTLYPPTWLNLLLSPATYYSLYVFAHLSLAGLGARALARRLGMQDTPALAAGAIYMASGPVLSLVNVWHHLAGAAFLPWVLVAALEAMEVESAARVLPWSVLPALQIVAGSPDLCLWSWLVALPLVFYGPQPLARLGRLSLLGAGAAVLGAGQWLATLEAAFGSARLELSEAKRTFWSVHPMALVQLFVPVSNADLAASDPGGSPPFELASPFLKSVYLGLATLPLAAAGFSHPHRLRSWAIGSGSLALLFALGRHTPVQALATLLLPFLGILRYPAKAMPVFALAWALGFGLGVAAARRDRPRWTIVGALAVSTLALAAGQAGRVSAAVAVAAGALVLGGWRRSIELAAILAVGELAFAHRDTNPTMERRLFAARPAVLNQLPAGSRLHAWDYVMPVPGMVKPWPRRIGVLQEHPAGYPAAVGNALAMREYLYPPAAARFGLFGSFDPDLLDLGGRRAYDMNLMARFYWGAPAYARLLALGSVEHVLALHDEGFETFERVALVRGLFSEPIRVYRPPVTLPRAHIVSGVRVASEPDAYRLLVDPSFDAGREMILAQGADAGAGPALVGSASVTQIRADQVHVVAQVDRPAYLVLADAWDEGWRASIDGRPAAVLRANVLFRAVALPGGRHEIVFAYEPWLLRVGIAVSCLGVIGLLGLAVARLQTSRSGI